MIQDNKNRNLLFYVSNMMTLEPVKHILDELNPMHLDRDQQTPLIQSILDQDL